MAIFQITVYKETTIYSSPGEEWANIYHCNVPALDNADLVADSIVAAERPLYSPDVVITRVGIRPFPISGVSLVQYSNEPGDRAAPLNVLPNWNVCRVDWAIQNESRGARKYLRVTLGQDDVSEGTLSGAVQTMLNAYATAIDGIADICGPRGGLFVSGSGRVDPRMAMRQTYWSRRARPGQHRAYVPNT